MGDYGRTSFERNRWQLSRVIDHWLLAWASHRPRWAARPEDCLMVGDSPADMEAGKRAGVKTSPDFWIDDLRALAP